MNGKASFFATVIIAVATSFFGMSHFTGQNKVESDAGSKAIAVTDKVRPIVGINVKEVDSVGLTVHDMDAELKFFTEVLPFKKVSDEEVVGDDFEELFGVFGCRARVVRLQLGNEFISLTQFLACLLYTSPSPRDRG